MINVTTGEFYGPFDLLLDLIKKSKYDIYEVKLSNITNEYLESINSMDIPVDETSDFILIATQLLYIKTRSLVKDTIDVEEDEDLISEDELLRRIIEYKKIKSVIKDLRILEDEGSKRFTKLQEDLSIFKKENIEINYDLDSLKLNLEYIIDQLLKDEEFKVDKILNIEEYSLEKYSTDIKIKLIKDKIVSITKMLKTVEKKSEAIIIFLSILELSRNKNINIFQDKETEEIVIEMFNDAKEDNNEQ